ncbi:hypothetical protein F3K42_22360, partial [Klebsiella pneumoniae]|uniref:hypothetical protein n=1 Tax=Klebsiella pneumoniae TaxID=573 RepID=UPI001231FC99
EQSVARLLFFNNTHTEGTKNTTDYVAHKYEAKYVTIINELNRWGEIIGLPTAITYYPKHQNIHSSDERTEIKHTFFFCRLWYTARPSH